MSRNKSQNPDFRVDPAAFEACRPKVVCRSCGTIVTPKLRDDIPTMRCPSCRALHKLHRDGNDWRAELITGEDEGKE